MTPTEMLAARGLDTYNEPEACKRCKGTGYFEYSNTSTWHGGMGGCAMTTDVCSTCWGSGSVHPWPSHREFEQMQKRLTPKNESLTISSDTAVWPPK
jgi:DnaJ-class molecular chaperone